jgi:basic amino acid/polyamine antiporter, APA family
METHSVEGESVRTPAPVPGTAAPRTAGDSEQPRRELGIADAAAIIVGVVVGAGIFRFPSFVAGNTDSVGMMMGAWLLGGVIALIGALCYAELSTAFPSTGGDYHFLTRALGSRFAFLYAWARMAIIQSGSIALVAFLIGDYLTQIRPVGGDLSSGIYAASVVALLTAANLLGVRQGKGLQNVLTGATILGLFAVIVVGLAAVAPASPPPAGAIEATTREGAFGMAMVFVLLTYGGWNEASYLSAEVRGGGGNLAKALFAGIALITLLYLLATFAFVRGLGLEGLAASEAPAADLMAVALGQQGVVVISLLVAVAAISTLNATIITGARTNHALGRDFRPFGFMGNWSSERSTPRNALLVQGAISLLLVGVGSALVERSGVSNMVDYTAPIFWFFLMLVGVSLFVLRVWEPDVERPYRIPLYPVTPLVFIGACVYMLNSSLNYAGPGAMIGIGVLGLGLLLLLAFPEPRRVETLVSDHDKPTR